MIVDSGTPKRLQEPGPTGGAGYGIVIVACVILIMFPPNYAQFQLSPLASQIMETYALDAAQFSSLFSAAMIPGILLSLVAGLLCDRFGAKRTIAFGAAVSVAALTARIFVPGYGLLFACMVLAGVGATFINANLAKIVGQWFRPEQMGIAVGVAMTASTGAQAAGLGTGALFPSIGTLFVFTAALAATGLVVWLLFFRERTAPGAVRSDRPDAQRSKGQPSQSDQLAVQPSLKACLKTVTSSKNIWILGLGLGLTLAALMCMTSFLPLVLQTQRGMDPVSAGATSTVCTVGSLIGSIVVPMINTRVGRLKPVVFAFAIVAAVGTALAWQMPEGAAMILTLFVAGFSVAGIMVSLVSVPFLLPEIGPVYAGTAGGVASTMQLVGGVVIPSYIMTPIIGENWPVFFVVAGALCLGVAVCVILLPEVLGRNDAVNQEAAG